MSVKIMGAVWDSDLPQNERMVLLAYADHASHDGGNVYPSVNLIAWKTKYSRRTVQRVKRRLVDQKIMIMTGVMSYPSGTSVPVYRINVSKLPSRPPLIMHYSEVDEGGVENLLDEGGEGCHCDAGDNDDQKNVTDGAENVADVTQTVTQPSIKKEEDDSFGLFPKDDPALEPDQIPVAVDSLVKGSDEWKEAKRKALGGSAVGMMVKISAEHHKLIDEDTTRGGRLLRVWLDSKGIDVHRVPQKRKEDDAETLVGMVADLGISDDDAVSVLRTLLDPEGDNGWKATNVYKNVYVKSLAADYAVAALTHLSQNGKGKVVLLDKKKKSGIHIVL